jgi:hypothetical protein
MQTNNSMTKMQLSELEKKNLFFHNRELWRKTSTKVANNDNEIMIKCVRVHDGQEMSFKESEIVPFHKSVEIN